MTNLFSILMILAMLAVLISLTLGLFVMAKGGALNKKHSNKLMRLRVGLQALALVCFVLAILTR